MNKKYEQVKNDFLTGKFKDCKTYFEKNKYYVEAGYCYLILDKFDKAKNCFEKQQYTDPRAHWGLLLLQMISGQITTVPTYFEVRNFLEIDLDIFFTYKKVYIIERIIAYCDFLAVYNLECYKFIGRAFWSHNYIPAGMFFLQKAKDKLYTDPELHYLLAYIYYYNEKDINKCNKELETCLNLLPQYAPANKLKKILNCS